MNAKERKLVIMCCRALYIRDEINDGLWPDRKIPQCFHEFREVFLPHLGTDVQWLMVVESAIRHRAVELVVKELCS